MKVYTEISFEAKPITDSPSWRAPLIVHVSNQIFGRKGSLRHEGKGFFLSVNSTDDLACYIDVQGGISSDVWDAVVSYLQNPVGLKSPHEIAGELLPLFPKKLTQIEFS